jgi:monothiol glutaredoxin
MAHPLQSKIEEKIHADSVVIFMKGTPSFPQCGFSAKACKVLQEAGVKELTGVDVLADDPLWDALEDYTKWPTVPQIFIRGEFVGGCDIICEMYANGELQALLQKQ